MYVGQELVTQPNAWLSLILNMINFCGYVGTPGLAVWPFSIGGRAGVRGEFCGHGGVIAPRRPRCSKDGEFQKNVSFHVFSHVESR